MADGNVQGHVSFDGPVGDEDVCRAEPGAGLDHALAGASNAVRLKEVDEPVLDCEVPAVFIALFAGDGVVTKDVYGVSAKGAGFACQLLFQNVHPQEPAQQQPKLTRGAGVAQGWGWLPKAGAGGTVSQPVAPGPSWKERRTVSRLDAVHE